MQSAILKKTSIFEKLTDSSQYTGSHQHRFDASGRGRGLAGRDRIVKGIGTVDAPYVNGTAIRDLSQITRTNLRDRQSLRPKSAIPSSVRQAKHRRCHEQSCTSTCSPISKHGYCSYHMWQENEAAPFPTNSRCIPQSGQGSRPSMSGLIRSRSLVQIKPKDGTSRSNDEPQVTMERVLSRKNISDSVPSDYGKCHVKECFGNAFTTGYCSYHSHQFQDIKEPADSFSNDPLDQESGAANSNGQADRVLSRLTDPRLYTGSHQHRFDKFGRGRGLNGRESIPKGGAGFGIYHGGQINDISQIMRL